MKKILNYINGELTEPIGKDYLDNYDPSIGEVYSHIPDSDERDILQAVDAAKKAFPSWSELSANERSSFLLKISKGIEDKLETFALAESTDNGKPLALATKVDIPRAISNFKFFAEAINHFSSESHQMAKVAINYTLRNPLGPVACISPWNLPLYLFSWKIAP
ncbi:MAG: aldehyde dehydrogenase family protein, partial [Saprospiraceae bacterium]|nr:aldehyde dehydrogenase family protein [Saprospiraceae bacterium]